MVKLLTTARQLCARSAQLGIVVEDLCPGRSGNSASSGNLKPARGSIIITDVINHRSGPRVRRSTRRSFSSNIIIVDLIGS